MVGDVDPCRDLSIIADELRIKDMEFVEKHLEQLKKLTARGGQSLEVKAKKEEEAMVLKVLKHLQEEKDVRKGDWNNKEVSPLPFPCVANNSFVMTKSLCARYNPSSSSFTKAMR
jgi:obg-like ATPase 1